MESSERTEMGIAASIMVRSEDSTHPTFASLQPLLQPVEFLQRGEGCQVVDIEVAEFVHDGMLFRSEEGPLLFALLFRGRSGTLVLPVSSRWSDSRVCRMTFARSGSKGADRGSFRCRSLTAIVRIGLCDGPPLKLSS